jgi:hypothetical protein
VTKVVTQAEWPTIVAAAFAAVAACASWASVWQGRRERLAAATPELHLEVQQGLGTGNITLHITNNGGTAKKVRFCVIEGDQWIYGHPSPTGVFRPGESRLITTSARASGQKTAKGFVSGVDMGGRRLYLCTVTGGRRVYRTKGWRPARTLSDQTIIDELYPGAFDLKSMRFIPYETAEREL